MRPEPDPLAAPLGIFLVVFPVEPLLVVLLPHLNGHQLARGVVLNDTPGSVVILTKQRERFHQDVLGNLPVDFRHLHTAHRPVKHLGHRGIGILRSRRDQSFRGIHPDDIAVAGDRFLPAVHLSFRFRMKDDLARHPRRRSQDPSHGLIHGHRGKDFDVEPWTTGVNERHFRGVRVLLKAHVLVIAALVLEQPAVSVELFLAQMKLRLKILLFRSQGIRKPLLLPIVLERIGVLRIIEDGDEKRDVAVPVLPVENLHGGNRQLVGSTPGDLTVLRRLVPHRLEERIKAVGRAFDDDAGIRQMSNRLPEGRGCLNALGPLGRLRGMEKLRREGRSGIDVPGGQDLHMPFLILELQFIHVALRQIRLCLGVSAVEPLGDLEYLLGGVLIVGNHQRINAPLECFHEHQRLDQRRESLFTGLENDNPDGHTPFLRPQVQSQQSALGELQPAGGPASLAVLPQRMEVAAHVLDREVALEKRDRFLELLLEISGISTGFGEIGGRGFSHQNTEGTTISSSGSCGSVNLCRKWMLALHAEHWRMPRLNAGICTSSPSGKTRVGK